MKTLFLLLAMSFVWCSGALANSLTQSYRFELRGQASEGVVLVEQQANGQPAYSVSTFVNGRPRSTRVLIKSYFDRYVKASLAALPVVESWKDTGVIRCSSLVVFTATGRQLKKSKQICFEGVRVADKAKFSTLYSQLKRAAQGEME